MNSSKTIRSFFQMLVIGKSWHSLLTVYVLNGFPSLTIVGDDGGWMWWGFQQSLIDFHCLKKMVKVEYFKKFWKYPKNIKGHLKRLKEQTFDS